MLGGGLFSRYFLDTGIRTTAAWSTLAEDTVIEFSSAARAKFKSFQSAAAPNEAVTEQRLIFPIIQLLGWDLLPQQQATRRREDVPDALLFTDGGAVSDAMRQPVGAGRYRLADVVHESKRWDLPLDRTTDAGGRTPASQALRYLRVAEELSNGRIRWALLSNGRIWRLYAYDVTSQAERFLEADLAAMLETGGEMALRVFLLLFRREAFQADAFSGRTVLQAALDEAREWQQAVTSRLSGAVFNVVFPELLGALSAADPTPRPDDPAWPETLRDAALVLLYRLLFVLYAEDRDLLPANHDGYRPFAITTLRREVDDAVTQGRPVSPTAATWWPRLRLLFRAISGGDDDMGLPPYNGGLFNPQRAPLLDRITLPDATFGRILDQLSIQRGAGEPSWINYRDLSVQQLGAIYEGLLELGVKAQQGIVKPVQDDTLRHGSGAYFTPEALVQLVMRQAVAPLLKERRDIFQAALVRILGDGRTKTEKQDDLQRFDSATAFLQLKICDPAMGSGHFLVSLVDWLSDETLAAMEEAADIALSIKYQSPLSIRIAEERARIEAAAALHGWPLDPRHLDDRQIVRRLLLKRVIFGVDLNPLAVELTKLSLWLHSFTVGAPLSYLDHHLRAGNSLFGAWIADTDLLASGAGRARRGGLALAGPIQAARSAAQAMEQIEELSDADIAQVRESAGLFNSIEHATAPLRAFLNCLHALMWLPPVKGKAAKLLREDNINGWLDGLCGDPVLLATGVPTSGRNRQRPAITKLLEDLRAIASTHRFLHWQPAFPGIWSTWQSIEPEGGFDAIIGNPPYVRQESLTPMKPVLKSRYAAYDGVADLYVYFFEQALRLLRPGGRVAFTVTNKWLKAGYAEALRGVLTERFWIESVTDFGHARGFFPGTDVFPSVLCARRPLPGQEPPAEVTVTVVPRDLVRMEALQAQVTELAFPMPLTELSREPWILEPPEVQGLLRKIRQAGKALVEYVGKDALYRGVLTGLNEAFVVDSATRDRLIATDAKSAELLRPFLRGQDIDRWYSDWAGLWMIFTRRGTDISLYPAIRAHLEPFRDRLEPQPDDWTGTEWRGRKPGSYKWYEIQDNIAYFAAFEEPKIIYQEIQYYPAYSLDTDGKFLNNKGYLIRSSDRWLLSVLNSPLFWWFGWRHFGHMKDEALTPQTVRLESLPIVTPDAVTAERAATLVDALHCIQRERQETKRLLKGWLSVTWNITKPPTALLEPFSHSVDEFAAALRAALPANRRTLTATAVAAIRAEYAATIAPMTTKLAQAAHHENTLSALVNQAYGITPEDEALLWATAPPRMPIPDPASARSVGISDPA